MREVHDLGEELPVRPALVQVIAAGAHVVDTRRHATLSCRAALSDGVLRKRRIDAGVHVGINQARECQPVLRIEDFPGSARRDSGCDPGELALADGDVRVLYHGRVGPDDAHVSDQEIEFLLGSHGFLIIFGAAQDTIPTADASAPMAESQLPAMSVAIIAVNIRRDTSR
jgi:hypothetical protein